MVFFILLNERLAMKTMPIYFFILVGLFTGQQMKACAERQKQAKFKLVAKTVDINSYPQNKQEVVAVHYTYVPKNVFDYAWEYAQEGLKYIMLQSKNHPIIAGAIAGLTLYGAVKGISYLYNREKPALPYTTDDAPEAFK